MLFPTLRKGFFLSCFKHLNTEVNGIVVHILRLLKICEYFVKYVNM